MKTLKTLLSGLPEISIQHLNPELLSVKISAVTSDSRQVKPGSIFVAVKGGQQDGHRFIQAVEKAGAALVLGEEPRSQASSTPYLQVKDSRWALACLAAHYYGNPSHGLLVIGVTGTSGKTTTTYLLESILAAAGHRVGVIGTINFRFEGKVIPSTHTTPGPVELQALLHQMKTEGCTAVVMEVSSHALKQHRTACIAFDGAIFTNLTPEHLDFHPDMEDYYQSKALLFKDVLDASIAIGKKPVVSINEDDEYGRRLLSELKLKKSSLSKWSEFGMDSNSGATGKALQISLSGIRGSVGSVEVHSSLTGRFNASNILGAIGVTLGLGITPELISRGIQELKSVPGRLERVADTKGIHILVDYAHKPDALEKVLKTLKEVRGTHQLITVFGCGGDRDRKKRPVMGKIAVELSDQVWITSDNPRTENPQSIIDEILQGTQGFSNFRVETDRRKAIFEAVQSAKAGDLVLIAGKGHEDYQIVSAPGEPGGTRKIHFDDREVAAEALDT